MFTAELGTIDSMPGNIALGSPVAVAEPPVGLPDDMTVTVGLVPILAAGVVLDPIETVEVAI